MPTPPFDDQLIFDVAEDVTLGTLGHGSSTIASCIVVETGVQTVQAGFLSLFAREYRITMGTTQCPTRPVEGAQVTLEDGSTATIFSVIWNKLASFYTVGARYFAIPGGLTGTGSLARRDSTEKTSDGLIDPDWTNYATDAACLVMPRAQAADTGGETAVDTTLAADVVFAGFYEMRAGDRFTDNAAVEDPTAVWTVDAVQPYDASLGATIFSVTRRI